MQEPLRDPPFDALLWQQKSGLISRYLQHLEPEFEIDIMITWIASEYEIPSGYLT